jgi:hypothetical protein
MKDDEWNRQSLLKNKLHFVAQLSMLPHWSRLEKPCYFSVLNKDYELPKILKA